MSLYVKVENHILFSLVFSPVSRSGNCIKKRKEQVQFKASSSISLAYHIYSRYLYDRKTPEQGGRRVAFFREWIIWKYMRDYFPIKLIKTVDLDPNKNYILGYHPHGIMCTGAFLNFATDATGFPEIFPGLQPHLLTLAGQFMFPFFREYFMTTGKKIISFGESTRCIKLRYIVVVHTFIKIPPKKRNV